MNLINFYSAYPWNELQVIELSKFLGVDARGYGIYKFTCQRGAYALNWQYKISWLYSKTCE